MDCQVLPDFRDPFRGEFRQTRIQFVGVPVLLLPAGIQDPVDIALLCFLFDRRTAGPDTVQDRFVVPDQVSSGEEKSRVKLIFPAFSFSECKEVTVLRGLHLDLRSIFPKHFRKVRQPLHVGGDGFPVDGGQKCFPLLSCRWLIPRVVAVVIQKGFIL